MIKCFFVDVKSIKSDLPKSNFVESELEQLADLILETDGLLRPLILQEIKTGKYKVIEGHREYYAAVRAKEKNITKAEMVNAFVIDASNRKSAIAQLALLSESPLPGVNNATDSSQLDRLLPAIESAISEQLQPILAQLSKHTEMLDRLGLARSIPTETTTTIEPIIERVKPQSIETPIPSDLDLPKPSESKAKQTTKSTRKKTPKTVDPSPSINISSKEISQPPKPIEGVTVTKSTKSNPKTKSPSDFLGSIDPTKATTVLNLINTLDRQQLTVSMERSGLKTSVKFVPNIIEYRDKLPNCQIDRWETILDAKISGLNETAIKKIIDKLK
jgi:ParB-like nuclease domain